MSQEESQQTITLPKVKDLTQARELIRMYLELSTTLSISNNDLTRQLLDKQDEIISTKIAYSTKLLELSQQNAKLKSRNRWSFENIGIWTAIFVTAVVTLTTYFKVFGS